MKTNRQSTTIKGFQLEIFKVPNALHVTIANCGSISKCMQFSVSFAGALFYLQDVFQNAYYRKTTSMHIREVKANFDKSESKILIILK